MTDETGRVVIRWVRMLSLSIYIQKKLIFLLIATLTMIHRENPIITDKNPK